MIAENATITQKSVLIICSSPNGRGIHQYAQGLKTRIKGAAILAPHKRVSYSLWELFVVLVKWKEIKNYDIVVFANSRVSPFIWPLLKTTRVYVVIHDFMDTMVENRYRGESEVWHRKIRRIVNTWMIRGSLNRAAGVIVNSNTTRDQLCDTGWGSQAKVYVVNPGPSFGENQVQRATREGVTEANFSKRLELLSVTGSTRNKCLGDYFKLVDRLVRDEGIDIAMVLVGVEERDVPKSIVDIYEDNRERITLNKGISSRRLVEMYIDCHAYISLSIDEGYGIPLADAAGFGVPVVARNIPAFSEIAAMNTCDGSILLGRDLRGVVRLIKENAKEFQHNSKSLQQNRISRVKNYMHYRREYELRASRIMQGMEKDWR